MRQEEFEMEKFVLAGKAKTVFQIIELMARGETATKAAEAESEQIKLRLDNTYQLWPSRN